MRHTAVLVLGCVVVMVSAASGGGCSNEPIQEAGRVALEDRLAQLKLDEENHYTSADRSTGYGGSLARWREQEKIAAAIELFDLDEAIRLDPKDPKGYSERGKVHLTAEMYGKAIQDLTEAISLYDQENKNHGTLLWYRGLAYYSLYLYEDAIRDFTEQIRLEPECDIVNWPYCGDGHWFRGTAYYRLGQYEKAIQDFTAAIEFEKYPENHFLRRGNVRKVLGQDRLAAHDFQRACDLMGYEPGHRLIPGEGYQYKDDVDSAIRNSLGSPYDSAKHFRYTVEYSYYCD